MRIVTWNIGIFSWFKYARHISFTSGGHPILHEYFQPSHASFVIDTLKSFVADVIVLQELFTVEDASVLIEALRETHPYHELLDSWYHKHTILILSTAPLSKEPLGDSGFYILNVADLHVVPIHLNSFSAKKRLIQTKNLLRHLAQEDRTPVCILGDTNFWHIESRSFFFFKEDKTAYDLFTKNLIDVTTDIRKTSKIGLNLDKIFLSPELALESVICKETSAPYMDHFPLLVDFRLPSTEVEPSSLL